MKRNITIKKHLHDLHLVTDDLNAMNAEIQSIIIAGGRPVIRIVKNDHCAKMIETGEAHYFRLGGPTGQFFQGSFKLHGCRVMWSESLH